MPQSQTEVASAVVLSSICSISMTLLNKYVMDTHKLDYPWGLLLLQNTSALVLVVIAKQLGLVQYPDLDPRVMRKWLPLTVIFVAMLYTSMRGIADMSVAVMTILKNTATILTALGDVYLFGRRLTGMMILSFFLMFVGMYLGTSADRWITGIGLFWTFFNVITTVAYCLYMKTLLSNVSSEIGKYGPVFYNNLLSIPFLLFPAAPTFHNFTHDAFVASHSAQTALAAMIFIGSVMTFATFWCMKVTSPTTFAVVGTMNKIPLLLLGVWIFNQPPSTTGAIGMLLALGGGALYTYLNLPGPKTGVTPPASDMEEIEVVTGGASKPVPAR